MTRMQAILCTLIAYELAMIVIGLVANRMSRDEKDYFLGGRRLGPWVAGLSASASSSSVWTLLGVSGYAYAYGLAAAWLLPACVGGFALNWFILAPALRRESARCGAITVTEMLAGPIGTAKRWPVIVLASTIVLLSLLTYVAAQFQGAGKTFAETFDMGFTPALLIGAAIVVFYTLLGGFWAASITDTVQGMMMAAAALALPIAALVAIGGFEGLIAGMQAVEVEGWLSWTRGMPLAAGVGLVLGLLGIGLGYPGQPHVVNRLMALRDDAALVGGRRISMTWAMVIYAGMIVLGWSVRVLIPDLADPEDAFMAGTERALPPVLAGVMIAAVLSAIMSTVDSQLLVAASTISHDLIGRAGERVDEVDGERRVLLRSRRTVLGLSLGAIGVALWVDEGIFASVLFAWTAMGSAFGPLLLVTVLVRRPRPEYVLAAMSAGFLLSVIAYVGKASGVVERVVPFAIALGLACWGARRDGRS
ncbi:sodium/proline symporter [Nannocystaceae bacterium ST9]